VEARWTQWSQDHVADDVAWHEVEEALLRPIVTQGARDGSAEVLGQTFDGRYLAMCVTRDEGARTMFVITARTMTDAERRRYRRREWKG
jgi:uncharacterized DUF497 family protein